MSNERKANVPLLRDERYHLPADQFTGLTAATSAGLLALALLMLGFFDTKSNETRIASQTLCVSLTASILRGDSGH